MLPALAREPRLGRAPRRHPLQRSRRSHVELDESDELDRGDPEELASLYRELKPYLPSVRVIGGCWASTPHIAAICERWPAPGAPA